jgi:hypothetical protein
VESMNQHVGRYFVRPPFGSVMLTAFALTILPATIGLFGLASLLVVEPSLASAWL